VADLDTTSKRRSHLSLAKPWMQVLPEPTGAIEAGDRQHLAYLYSGISAGSAEPITGTGAVVAVAGAISGSGEAGFPYRSIWEFNKPQRRTRAAEPEIVEQVRITGRGAVVAVAGRVHGTGRVALPVFATGHVRAAPGTMHGYGAVPDDANEWDILGLDEETDTA
jgi:hypothetical protein